MFFLIVVGVFWGLCLGAAAWAVIRVLRADEIVLTRSAPEPPDATRERLAAIALLCTDGLITDAEAAERRVEILAEL